MALLLSYGKRTTRFWLISIAVAGLLQSISTAIITAANANDLFEEENSDIPAFGLSSGSENDENAIFYIFAQASWVYNWALLTYLLVTFGYLTYQLSFIYKKQTKIELVSQGPTLQDSALKVV